MRPKTKAKRSVVTTRDLKMLEFIIESKLASRDQLNFVFFKNSKCKRVINRRINKLMQRNLISRIGVQINDRFLYCYELTDVGIDTVKGSTRLSITKAPQRSEKPQHDLTLVELRLKISSFNEVTDYLTENVIQSFDICAVDSYLLELKAHNSDAAIRVKVNSKSFWLALEFENTLQSLDKLEKKVTKIYDSKINAIIFVCKNSSTLSSLQNIEKKHLETTTSSPKIFYQKLDVLLKSNESISVINILNQSLTIK